MTSNPMYDVAVVGGGPAGLSAAVWLSRYLHRVVLVDSGDPRNWETRGINGFLGHPGIRPAELRGMDEFHLELADGTPYAARRILLAIGLRDVWPRIPGLRQVYGANAHVCPDCDGLECQGKKVVVIGHGRKAVGMALNLTTWTSDIIICTNGEPADMDEAEYCQKLDALNIPVLESRISCIEHRDERVHALELENGMSLDADKIFFAIGQYPHDDLGAQLGCARDEGGHIIVDDAYHTSVVNCFAAGDIVPGPQLAIAAAGDGAIAALAIHKSLVPNGRKLTAKE
jgi:thioredoxin reductase